LRSYNLEECDPVGITEYSIFDVCVQGTERAKVDGWSGKIECAVKGFEKKITFQSQGIPRLVCLAASEGLYELSIIGGAGCLPMTALLFSVSTLATYIW